MTRRQIEQYTSIKREIAMLEEQIYEARCAGEYATDMVQASMQAIPYAVHNVVISGYTSQHVPKLLSRKAALEAQCTDIERHIEGINDSALRQLLIRRYIEGKGIAEAARLVGYSKRQAIRLVNTYFEKMSPNVT